MKSLTYLGVDIACLIIPLLCSFYRPHSFYKEWKYFFLANGIVAFLFLVWDAWFTEMGVWGFNSEYLIGIFIGNLPIEEVLFFVCIPYACVFTYFAFKHIFLKKAYSSKSPFLMYGLLGITTFIAFFHHDKQYTFYTALFSALFLLYCVVRKSNLTHIVFSYIAVLPFFFLSNGILTGMYSERPVVWYNDLENTSIRIFSIPIEDILYGFLLILMNIVLYEQIKKHKTLR